VKEEREGFAGRIMSQVQTGSQGRFEEKLRLEQDENTPTGFNDSKKGNVNPVIPWVDGSAPGEMLT